MDKNYSILEDGTICITNEDGTKLEIAKIKAVSRRIAKMYIQENGLICEKLRDGSIREIAKVDVMGRVRALCEFTEVKRLRTNVSPKKKVKEKCDHTAILKVTDASRKGGETWNNCVNLTKANYKKHLPLDIIAMSAHPNGKLAYFVTKEEGVYFVDRKNWSRKEAEEMPLMFLRWYNNGKWGRVPSGSGWWSAWQGQMAFRWLFWMTWRLFQPLFVCRHRGRIRLPEGMSPFRFEDEGEEIWVRDVIIMFRWMRAQMEKMKSRYSGMHVVVADWLKGKNVLEKDVNRMVENASWIEENIEMNIARSGLKCCGLMEDHDYEWFSDWWLFRDGCMGNRGTCLFEKNDEAEAVEVEYAYNPVEHFQKLCFSSKAKSNRLNTSLRNVVNELCGYLNGYYGGDENARILGEKEN